MDARVTADRTSGQLSTEIAGSTAVTMHSRARFEVSWHDRLDGSGRQSSDLHWHQHHLSIRQMQASLQDQRRLTVQPSREPTGAHENKFASETGTVGISVVNPSFCTLPDNRRYDLDWTRAFSRAAVGTEPPKGRLQSGVKACDAGVGAHGRSPHDFACSRVGTFAVRPAVRRRPA